MAPAYDPPRKQCTAKKNGRQCQRWATVRSAIAGNPKCFSHGG